MAMMATKWMATAASIWIQCTSGSSYTFGIYSPVLKSTQGYTQSDLDVVSVFKDIGANVGFLSGLLLSAVPDRPWVVLLAGAVQSCFGYFMIWASVTGLVGQPPLWVMCIYILVAAHAQTFFNTANVVCGVRNFGDYGGTIVGILKGFVGISGAILIQFYNAVCKGDPTTYILLLALTPTVSSILFMGLVRAYEYREAIGDVKKYLNEFSVVALIIAAYLAVLIVLDNFFPLPTWSSGANFSFMILFIFVSSINIAIRAHRDEANKLSGTLFEGRDSRTTVGYSVLPRDEDQPRPKKITQDFDILRALTSLNFWLLFGVMFCALGSGVATVNNISQIGQSLNYETVDIKSLVSLWSIWNFLGRFGAGYISDVLLHRCGVSRPVSMVVTLVFLAIGHTVIASGFRWNLYLGSFIVGVAYGSQWSLMPTISSEIFGVTHLGTIFNTIAIASPLGSYMCSVKVIGYLYDKEATDGYCYGTKCFMSSFLILAGVAVVGLLLALVLYYRTRRFYNSVVHVRP